MDRRRTAAPFSPAGRFVGGRSATGERAESAAQELHAVCGLRSRLRDQPAARRDVPAPAHQAARDASRREEKERAQE